MYGTYVLRYTEKPNRNQGRETMRACVVRLQHRLNLCPGLQKSNITHKSYFFHIHTTVKTHIPNLPLSQYTNLARHIDYHRRRRHKAGSPRTDWNVSCHYPPLLNCTMPQVVPLFCTATQTEPPYSSFCISPCSLIRASPPLLRTFKHPASIDFIPPHDHLSVAVYRNLT